MIHVYPQHDLEEHDLHGTTCKCNPRVETAGEILVVHNSFDGREAVELATELLKAPYRPPYDDMWKSATEESE